MGMYHTYLLAAQMHICHGAQMQHVGVGGGVEEGGGGFDSPRGLIQTHRAGSAARLQLSGWKHPAPGITAGACWAAPALSALSAPNPLSALAHAPASRDK